MFGGAVRAVVIVLTIVIGLSQMGLDIRLVEYLLTIVAAATLAGFALAFGIGASPSVSNIIASRNVRRHYSVGQRVRVGDIQGTILELSAAFVVLDTDHGRTLIPAKVFEERISELLDTESSDEH
jgi:small-conductance mechanosensitive channel